MRDHCVPMCKRVSHQIVVGYLQERAHGSWVIALLHGPRTDRPQGGHDRSIGPQKERLPKLGCPFRQLICTGLKLVTYFVDAEDSAGCIALNYPIPEGGAKIQTIVEILRLDEDVRVQQVA